MKRATFWLAQQCRATVSGLYVYRRIRHTDRHHVVAGCWFGERRQAVRTIRQGARLVVYSNDGSMLRGAMGAAFTELRKG